MSRSKLSNQELKFYNSDLSQKWWFELTYESNKVVDFALIPCNYDDYLSACNDNISDKLLLSLKRNFI